MKYKNNFKEYTENGNIDFDQNTNALTFINKGTSSVKINNTFTLATDESLSISGNVGEIDFTAYNLSFVAGGTFNVIVITKVYV